jgi:hypothetical protein
VSCEGLWFFGLFFDDFGLLFGLLSLGGNGNCTKSFEVDLEWDMLFGAFDADGTFVDEAKVFDIPLFFDELSKFGKAGVVEDGNRAALFACLVIYSDIDVMVLHGCAKGL